MVIPDNSGEGDESVSISTRKMIGNPVSKSTVPLPPKMLKLLNFVVIYGARKLIKTSSNLFKEIQKKKKNFLFFQTPITLYTILLLCPRKKKTKDSTKNTPKILKQILQSNPPKKNTFKS